MFLNVLRFSLNMFCLQRTPTNSMEDDDGDSSDDEPLVPPGEGSGCVPPSPPNETDSGSDAGGQDNLQVRNHSTDDRTLAMTRC